MGKQIFMADISDAQVDDLCARKFWLPRMEAGRGVIARHDLQVQTMLQASQEDFRTIAQAPLNELTAPALTEAVTEILNDLPADALRDRPAMELLYRRLGWLVAWSIFIEPYMRPNFEEIALPPEAHLERDGILVRFPAGRLLRYRQCREVIYFSFVPTAFGSSRWREGWLQRAQPVVEMKAIAETANLDVDAMQVRGMMLGFFNEVNMTLNHPYVLAYHRTGTDEWTHSYTEGSKEGWRQRPVWEYPDGLVAWVLKCGKDIAEMQFPLSPRILFKKHIFDAWITHRLHRERQITLVAGDCHADRKMRDTYFPTNTLACKPVHGEPCSYQNICWSTYHNVNPHMLGYVTNGPLHRSERETEALVRLKDVQTLLPHEESDVVVGEVLVP